MECGKIIPITRSKRAISCSSECAHLIKIKKDLVYVHKKRKKVKEIMKSMGDILRLKNGIK